MSPGFSGFRFFRVQVFLSPGFSGSRFFRVQVFEGPGISGFGSRVRVQGLVPCFRSSGLSLVLTIDFCYLQLIFFCILFEKDTKIISKNKQRNILKRNEFITERWGVPLLNFVGCPGTPLLNFRGYRVLLLNFEGGTRSWVLGSRGPGPTYTPCHGQTDLLDFQNTQSINLF